MAEEDKMAAEADANEVRMEGFHLLLGHLVGDYILQNDWMAQRKAGQYRGDEETPEESR